MNSPVSQTVSAQTGRPAASPAPGLPDGPRVQEQLAALTESGELRPLIEFLRALLNARALAIFPGSENAGAASVVVTTRGILATALAPIGERLANTVAAVVEPAPSLGEEGYTLAVPVRRDEHPLWVLIAQLVVPNARDLQAFLVILQTVAGYLLYREQRLVDAKDKEIFLAAGARGHAAIYTEKGKFLHIIRKVFVRLSTKFDWFVLKLH